MTEYEMKNEFVEWIIDSLVPYEKREFTNESSSDQMPLLLRKTIKPFLETNKNCKITLLKPLATENNILVDIRLSIGSNYCRRIVSYYEFANTINVTLFFNNILFNMEDDLADYIFGRKG